jgi:hypothetical protein
MIHAQDELSLQRLLGTSNLPEPLLDEVEICTLMYHRDGGSGPLGSLALIAMLRRMRLGPTEAPRSEVKTDWQSLPQDGSVHVKAHYFGDWLDGVFLGFVEHGTLAIRINGDGVIRECRPDIVRYVETRELREAIEDPVPASAAAGRLAENPPAPTEDAVEDDEECVNDDATDPLGEDDI